MKRIVKYTDKQNRRRYRLHYKARKKGAEIITAEKTCKLPINSEPNSFVRKLIDEFNYVVQWVIPTPPRKLNT